jgi:dihydrofolate synthase/folylpolyglutamate synthase
MSSTLKNYDDTVHYLYSLQKHGIKLGLSNTQSLMHILGQPQKSFHSVHIAGTNGKGSTATAVASILSKNGFRVGLFTSPHLISFTERISINGSRITESAVIDTAATVLAAIKDTDLNPTFFEFVTAMAFYYFRQNSVDWAIVETGMGGRLDATNVIEPEVSVITNISMDHREFLGNTISDIAFEKAGIIKPRTPVITASGKPDVITRLTEIADSRETKIDLYSREFSGTLISMDDRHIMFDYSGNAAYNNLSMPVSGGYQLYNACMAIRAAELLRMKGFSLSDDSIKSGLNGVNLEGRLERVSDTPPVIIDSAHNPDAAASLADSIKELFPGKKIILIAGIMDDKDITEILKPIVRVAHVLILTRAKYERAASSEKLRGLVSSILTSESVERPETISSTDSVSEALKIASAQCTEDSIILAAGSFYTTGEVKEVLGHKGILSGLRE